MVVKMGPTHIIRSVGEGRRQYTVKYYYQGHFEYFWSSSQAVFLILLHTIWIIIRITKLRVELLNKTPNKIFLSGVYDLYVTKLI